MRSGTDISKLPTGFENTNIWVLLLNKLEPSCYCSVSCHSSKTLSFVRPCKKMNKKSSRFNKARNQCCLSVKKTTRTSTPPWVQEVVKQCAAFKFVMKALRNLHFEIQWIDVPAFEVSKLAEAHIWFYERFTLNCPAMRAKQL